MTGNNPKSDHVNINTYSKFDEIWSICSKDIERQLSSEIITGRNSVTNLRKMTANNHKLDLVNINAQKYFIKFY